MDVQRATERLNNLWHVLRNDVYLVGDADREKATSTLSCAYALGYIDRAALDRRTAVALSAHYEHQLYWATCDLPELPSERPVPEPEPEGEHSLGYYLAAPLIFFVFVLLAVFVVALVPLL